MTQTSITRGGVRHDTQALVQTSGNTVSGDGTTANPIRLSQVQVEASVVGDLPIPGTPMAAVASPTPGASLLVELASSTGTSQQATVIGLSSLAISSSGKTLLVVQYAGRFRQSADAWDRVTGGVGGLTPGPYYLGNEPGALSPVPLALPGVFRSQVGVALDAETMALSTPSVPVLI